MNNIFVTHKGGEPVKVRQSSQSFDCFYVQRPPVFNLTTMHVNKTKQDPPESEFTKRYWQRIHELNNAEAPKARPATTPVGQYVLHLIEPINLD
jgi:hypothetical protein